MRLEVAVRIWILIVILLLILIFPPTCSSGAIKIKKKVMIKKPED